MTTSHLLMAHAVVALLQAEPAVAGGRAYSARTRAIPKDVLTAVNVRLERSTSQLASVIGGRISWATLISVECYGRLDGGSSDEAADQVLEEVFARLASDPSLGGLAMSVEPLEGDTLSWDFDALDSNMACVTAKFIVKHQTTGRTLTQ